MVTERSADCYTRSDHEDFFVGWPNKPSYESVLRHFHSAKTVFLVDDSQRVVGFVSGITDGELFGFVALLEVREEEQGKGYGKSLVAELLEDFKGVYAIDLVCDLELESFYEPFGFSRQLAMSQRHRENLL